MSQSPKHPVEEKIEIRVYRIYPGDMAFQFQEIIVAQYDDLEDPGGFLHRVVAKLRDRVRSRGVEKYGH